MKALGLLIAISFSLIVWGSMWGCRSVPSQIPTGEAVAPPSGAVVYCEANPRHEACQ